MTCSMHGKDERCTNFSQKNLTTWETRHWLENNINMNFKEIGFECGLDLNIFKHIFIL
jgi:hypothetical protein